MKKPTEECLRNTKCNWIYPQFVVIMLFQYHYALYKDRHITLVISAMKKIMFLLG